MDAKKCVSVPLSRGLLAGSAVCFVKFFTKQITPLPPALSRPRFLLQKRQEAGNGLLARFAVSGLRQFCRRPGIVPRVLVFNQAPASCSKIDRKPGTAFCALRLGQLPEIFP